MENLKDEKKQPESEQTKINAIALLGRDISDKVLGRVNELEKEGGLYIPKNYSAANALKSAWLILQNVLDKNDKPALTVCTKESIANSLLDMVIQGLSPVKKQCYFIVRGAQLTLTRSYHGSIAVTKRLNGIEDVFANCIYENDEFEYVLDLKTGMKVITKHIQSFENIDITKIRGAYALILRKDLPPYIEIMNIKQIRLAWEQGSMKGKSGAHVNFTDEMCKKTVINRACKTFQNTSDDSDVLVEAINRTTDIEDLPETSYVEEPIEKEIEQNANQEPIDIKTSEKPRPDKTTDEKNNGSLTPNEWESPIAIIAKVEFFTKLKELEKWNKDNESRISAIGGKDGEAIAAAIQEKKKKILSKAGI